MVGLGRLALASIIAASVARPAQAADWLKSVIDPPPGVEINNDPVELGTGWYLRGDAGVGRDSLPNLLNSAGSKTLPTWSVDLGAGYKLNDWLRVEGVLDLRKQQNALVSTTKLLNGNQIVCPNGTAGGNNALQIVTAGADTTILNNDGSTSSYKQGNNIGYVWDPILGTCSESQQTQVSSAALLLNFYIDLGTWKGFTPYIGAGVGVSRLATSSSTNFYNTTNGQLYAPTAAQWTQTGATPLQWVNAAGQALLSQTPTVPGVAAQPTIPNTTTVVSISTPPSWNKKSVATIFNPAWALMAGVGYSLTERAKIDLGFRYLNLGTIQPVPGSSATGQFITKEVKVGFRYLID